MRFRSVAFFTFLSALALIPLYQGGAHLWATSICAFLIASSFLLRVLSTLRSPSEFTPSYLGHVYIAYFVFLGVFIISVVQSRIPSLSYVEAYKLALVSITFALTLHFCQIARYRRILITLLLVVGTGLSVFGLLQYGGVLPKHWWHIQRFLSSVYVNHNHFAALLALVLPLGIGLSVVVPTWWKRLLLIIMSGTMGAAFILTLSRADGLF